SRTPARLTTCTPPAALFARSGAFPGADPVGAHLAVEVAALQTEQLRRAQHVAARLAQFFQDEGLLERLAALAQGGVIAVDVQDARWRASLERRGDTFSRDAPPRRQDDEAFDQVAQLAHIAGPRMRRQRLDRPVRQVHGPPVLARQDPREMVREQ